MNLVLKREITKKEGHHDFIEGNHKRKGRESLVDPGGEAVGEGKGKRKKGNIKGKKGGSC